MDDTGKAMLTDFGMGVLADAHSGRYASNHGGAYQYCAPEILDPDAVGAADDRPTRASDIYSFAMVCVEVRVTRLLCWYC